MAAKNDEKRLADFQRRLQYSKQWQNQAQLPYRSKPQQSNVSPPGRPRPPQPGRSDRERDLRRPELDPKFEGKMRLGSSMYPRRTNYRALYLQKRKPNHLTFSSPILMKERE